MFRKVGLLFYFVYTWVTYNRNYTKLNTTSDNKNDNNVDTIWIANGNQVGKYLT